jgi:low affinity Fe/Cu permease
VRDSTCVIRIALANLTAAACLKLDELIRAVASARTELVDMEDLSDDELRRLQEEFEKLRSTAEGKLRRNRRA